MKHFFSLFLTAMVSFLVGVGERINGVLFTHMNRVGGLLAMGEVPSVEDFNSRRVTNPGQSEVVRQRLYDWQLYPVAGASQLTFFSQTPGSGVTTAVGAVVGQAKSQWDTNLELSGTLPSGKAFMIESIEIHFLPGSSAAANTYTPATITAFNAIASATVDAKVNDANIFYQAGLCELNVLSKNYLRETPAMAFPPKTYLGTEPAVANTSATTGQVGQSTPKALGRAYYLTPEVTLQPAVNFEFVIRYPSAVALPSGFNARVGVIFDGFLMRASQ